MGQRARALRAVVLIALGTYVIGTWLPRAWSGRWIADDYCFAVSAMHNGFWRSQVLVYNNSAGRYTVAFLYAVLAFLGTWTARWLSLGAMAAWLIAAWRAAHHAFRITRLEEIAAAIGFVAAVVSTAPDAYQPLIWTGGLLTYGLPVIGATVMLGIVLHPRRGAAAILFVLAIVFGGCSEIAALSQTVFAGTFAILSRRARPLLTSIAIGSAVALVIVAIAPGNFHRRELFHPLPIPDASLAAAGEAIPTFGKILVEGSTLFVPLIVFVALIGARIPYLAGLSALVAGVVLVAATIFAGLAGTGRLPWGRVQFIPIAYVTIAIVLFALILGVERYATLATVVMIVFAVLAVVTTARSGMADIDDSRRFAAAADRVERSARVDSGASIVVAAPHDFDYLEYVHADPKFWSNRCMASYYGLTSIRSGR